MEQLKHSQKNGNSVTAAFQKVFRSLIFTDLHDEFNSSSLKQNEVS